MLFNTKVFKFWIMEKINIFEFFHFFNLIKIKPNMDFWGNLAFVDIWHKTHSLFYFFG
jgi:hypothetical protein